MNHSYTQIMNLPDSYEIKDIVRRWQTLSDNLDRLPPEMPVLLPDLFLIAGYGVGRTHVLSLLADYLSSQKNLMDFYGDVNFFEFFVNYRKPEETFTELPRLMESVSAAAGFRSEYRGIVSLDVDEWIGHCEEKHFIDLLEYLTDNSDRWLIVFTVSSGDRSKEEVSRMEAVLSMFLRIEKAELRLPDAEELLQYVRTGLMNYSIILKDDAAALLTASITKLSENKYFDGYKTLNMLICDIVYRIYSDKSFNRRDVSADELADFAEDGSYINARIIHYDTRKRYSIGFIGGTEE